MVTVENVATFEDLHWQTVKDIDKKAIEKAQDNEEILDGISTLGIDEKASGKEHKYLHMITQLWQIYKPM